MQPARHSELVQELWSEAIVLEYIVREIQSSDMCYWTTGQLIIFVHKEFGPVKILLSERYNQLSLKNKEYYPSLPSNLPSRFRNSTPPSKYPGPGCQDFVTGRG